MYWSYIIQLMAPPKPSGRRKEDFVQWKDSSKPVEREGPLAGAASPSSARKKKQASRPRAEVTEDIETEGHGGPHLGTENTEVSDSQRNTEAGGVASVPQRPLNPKYVSPNRFVPPRCSGLTTSLVTPPRAFNSTDDYARERSSSPQGRPLTRELQEQEEASADEVSGDPYDNAQETWTTAAEGKCIPCLRFVFAVVPFI